VFKPTADKREEKEGDQNTERYQKKKKEEMGKACMPTAAAATDFGKRGKGKGTRLKALLDSTEKGKKSSA